MILKWICGGVTFAAVVLAAAGCSTTDHTAGADYQATAARPVMTGVGDEIGQVVYSHVNRQFDQAWLGPNVTNPATENNATAHLDRD